jgi:serine/threonine protein kinase
MQAPDASSEATVREGGRSALLPHVDGYDVVDELARGGMGVVYRARHVATGREVALKLLAARLADDEDFLQRFQREVRLARDLRHPNIVRVVDAQVEHPRCRWPPSSCAGGRCAN